MPRHRHRLGLVTKLHEDATGQIAAVRGFGLDTCHLSVYRPDYLTEANRAIILAEAKQHDVEITAMWAGYPGKVVWDLIDGPVTTGLVPVEVREERAAIIKRSADVAASMGIHEIITHLGFVPEDLHDERYKSLIPVIRDIAAHLKKNGQVFCFETGQETPVTLLRTIEDVAMDNVGVNFDPANLLLYGKGNPVDALPLLGPHIRSVHAKDGFYPKDGRHLGEERPVGKGAVDFPRFLDGLAAIGYRGPLCIECDLPEEQRPAAIAEGKRALEAWLA
jgi:sugar phosphate isomerase/epimerase